MEIKTSVRHRDLSWVILVLGGLNKSEQQLDES